jgi:hypothetical protein
MVATATAAHREKTIKIAKQTLCRMRMKNKNKKS